MEAHPQAVQKEILKEFLINEEKDNLKNMNLSESLITGTKKIIEVLIGENYDYTMLSMYLEELQDLLSNEDESLDSSIKELSKIESKLNEELIEIQSGNEKKIEQFMSKMEGLKKKEENKDMEMNLIEKKYKELSGILKSYAFNPKLCSKHLNIFFEENNLLKAQVEKLKKTKEDLIMNYKRILRENLNHKAATEQFDFKKINDFLEEISTEDNLRNHRQRIKELDNAYYDVVDQYNALVEQISNVVRSLEGLNIDNPRLDKELEIINKEMYTGNKRLNRSFTQMYENPDWDEIDKDFYIKAKAKKNAYKNMAKKRAFHKSTVY